MKVEVPMVSWHNQVAIFGVDFHPSGRLATASQDGSIRVRSAPFLSDSSHRCIPSKLHLTLQPTPT